MKQVLYRKYRPKTFTDVVGQEHITSVLINEIKENKVAHAYLFTGSRGTGKTTCSKILAKAVNCLNPVDGNPCGECEVCKSIDSGLDFDVTEMDAASNNGVDDIRLLRQEAVCAPSRCKYRVYIIDEAHMLTVNAFNALLKIMEEPPEHVIFIMATTEVHKIPPTIFSRCQVFDFKRLSLENIADRLGYISEKEGFDLDRKGALLIAKLAKGGMRDAISILDVCSSKDSRITEGLVSSVTGLAENDRISLIADHLIDRDCVSLLKDLDGAYENSSDPQRICQQIIEYFRQMMIFSSVKNMEDLSVDMTGVDKLNAQIKKISIEGILGIINEFQRALDAMTRTPDKELALQMAVVKLCSSSEDSKSGSLLAKRIDELEKKLDKILKGNPIPQNIEIIPDFEPVKSEPITPIVKVEEKTKKDASPMKQWMEVMAILEKENPALYGSLEGSKAYICGNILLIECENEFFLTLVRKNEFARNSLRDAAEKVTGKIYKLGPFKKDSYNIKGSEEDPFENFINKLDTSMDGIELK